jgi:regulator of protease activity HflC (stomatin/prohibitin superfamily)
MSFHAKPKVWVASGVGLAVLVLLYQVWVWEVERIEVGPEKFVVRIHRWGQNLPEDEIVAPDESYKGILLDVLPEGRHFLNPIIWGHEIHEAVKVPPGKCLVMTRKYGKKIPNDRLESGDILAHEDERGILREVKGPGIHRINPYAYEFQMVDAVEVKDNEVGVRTLKIGSDPRELAEAPDAKGRYIVPDGFRGVQRTTVPPGSFYINPYVEEIKKVDTRSHKVELADIQFPSRDGFILQPHVQVEYQVRADVAPEVYVRLSDEGNLNQKDSTPQEQERNQILQKAILPQIRGYARIEGSNFDARDFIVTDQEPGAPKAANSREALQKALFIRVKDHCEDLGVHILAVKLETLDPPPELRLQISERDLAKVEQEKNRAKLGQLKAEQKLKAAEALKQQNTEKVQAETRLVQAKTKSSQLKEVEESRLKQELENAQLKLEAAKKEAEAKLAKGKAEAAVTMKQNEAQVAGLRTAVLGFSGAGQYAQYQILTKLAPVLSEIFASDDSDFAKLFAGYMTSPTAPSANKAPATGPSKPVAAPTMPPASDRAGAPGN